MSNNKLFVGGLADHVTKDVLQDLFAQAGNVEDVHIILDKFSGNSRGFGFVTMATPEEAQKAVEMFEGHELEGKTLKVNEARPREDRPRHGGGGGGGYRGGSGGSGGGGRRPFNKGGKKPFQKRDRY